LAVDEEDHFVIRDRQLAHTVLSSRSTGIRTIPRTCARRRDTEGVAVHSRRSKLSDYATARRERPTVQLDLLWVG
jgi:hypothetical protein